MKRRQFLITTAGASALTLARGSAQSMQKAFPIEKNDTPVTIGSRKQLFIDEKFIESSKGIELTINPPVKAGPIDLDAASEVSGMISIVEYEGSYQMYFLRKEGGFGVATSEDGLAWRRPRGDDVFGSGRALPLPGVGSGLVFIDPKEPEYPFKGIFDINDAEEWEVDPEKFGDVTSSARTQATSRGGLFLFRSPDGLKWELVKGLPVPFLCDTQNQVLYDSRIDKYVAYLRSFPMLEGPHRYKRCVVRSETADLYKMPWPYTPNPDNKPEAPHEYPYINDEMPIVMAPDGQDPKRTDLYGPWVNIYPQAQDVYLAFPPMYRCWGYSGENISFGRDRRGTISNDGLFETHLCVSRDGENWHRYRTPYSRAGLISDTAGLEGDLDCGIIYLGVGMVPKGDEIWQYYYGARRTHVSVANGEKLGLTGSGVFRLVQRLDGFVSADADHLGGEFTTPVLRFTGNRLQLNAACHGLGEIRVGIQNANGIPLPGYSMEEAVHIDRNGTAQEIWWQKGPDVSELEGQAIRLHIKMRSAKLYAFQFIKS